MAVIMKYCAGCSQNKSETEFSRDKNHSDGLSNRCKECNKNNSKLYRQKIKESVKDKPVRKKCSSCGFEKDSSEFYNDSTKVGGLSGQCIECIKKWRLENRDKLLIKSREHNKKVAEFEKIKVDERKCTQCNLIKPASEFWKSIHTIDGLYPCCKECKKILDSTEHRQEVRRKCEREWREKNIEKIRACVREYDKKRRKTDVCWKLKKNVSSAIISAVRKYGHFSDKAERFKKTLFSYLPYTPEELKAHIESLWEPWMNWDNYGKYDHTKRTWQIDHIIPQSKLPFSCYEDENFQILWALDNLRPLDTVENIKKKNKYSGSNNTTGL